LNLDQAFSQAIKISVFFETEDINSHHFFSIISIISSLEIFFQSFSKLQVIHIFFQVKTQVLFIFTKKSISNLSNKSFNNLIFASL